MLQRKAGELSEKGPQNQPKPAQPFKRVFWPEIYDRATAEGTAKYGAYTAWFMAASIVVLGIVAIWTGKDPSGEIVTFANAGGWTIYIATNAALVASLILAGFFCYRANRIAAIGTVALVVLELSSKMVNQSGRGMFLSAVLLLFAISGVRGAFAFARFRAQSDGSDKS